MTSYIRADKSKEALEADAIAERTNEGISILAKHHTIVTLCWLIIRINQLILP